MPINAHPEYIASEKEYHLAKTPEQRLLALEKMISTAPAHKGAENLRAQLRLRYKKLQESIEKSKKSGKSTAKSIKKENMQLCIVGFPNSGKTSIFKILTGQGKPSQIPFSTREPEAGAMFYQGCNIQVIDMPPFPNEDKSILNVTDSVLLVIEDLEEIKKAEQYLSKTLGKKIIIVNKTDKFSEEEKRKFLAKLQSKKIPATIFSALTLENLEEMKKKIFESFPIIRIYLKEPKKPVSDKPLIMGPGSNVKDVAEKILKGFSSRIKSTKITGPSAKFSGQKVGLEHLVKDKDIVEFQTV